MQKSNCILHLNLDKLKNLEENIHLFCIGLHNICCGSTSFFLAPCFPVCNMSKSGVDLIIWITVNFIFFFLEAKQNFMAQAFDTDFKYFHNNVLWRSFKICSVFLPHITKKAFFSYLSLNYINDKILQMWRKCPNAVSLFKQHKWI